MDKTELAAELPALITERKTPLKARSTSSKLRDENGRANGNRKAKRHSTSKLMRNREAQRAFRQREATRILDLEESVTTLQTKFDAQITNLNARIAAISESKETINFKFRCNMKILGNLMQISSASVSVPVCQECIRANDSSSYHKSEQNSPLTVDIRIQSSTSIYGAPHIAEALSAMLKLPSLADSDLPRSHYEIFKKTTEADIKTIQHCYLQLIKTRRSLLDACSVLDRLAAIEIIEINKARNKNHMDHMYQLLKTLKIEERQQLGTDEDAAFDLQQTEHAHGYPEKAHNHSLQKLLVDAIVRVSSLAAHSDLVNSFCNEISRYRHSKDIQERHFCFFRFMELQRQLNNLCNSEDDRIKFMLALEIGKVF
ncbi:hypothetical protein HK100_011147 [Physocladia obscura]|uniref:BZIP domain-containing protein n=1 Tax=Physocladia obscura TaxID=109957 RepID=A0AAD5XII1_9FUNG|nr:hypothetical protein HK100_011147 [Physocladia obscura]